MTRATWTSSPPFRSPAFLSRDRMLALLRYAMESDRMDARTSHMSRRDPTRLASYIRRHREAAGLSIRGLARASGMQPSTVLRLERGEVETPDPDKLERLAGVLEIDPEELFARYPAPEGLPEMTPYLRAKFGMSKEAVAEAEAFFAELDKRHGKKGKTKGGRRGKRAG